MSNGDYVASQSGVFEPFGLKDEGEARTAKRSPPGTKILFSNVCTLSRSHAKVDGSKRACHEYY